MRKKIITVAIFTLILTTVFIVSGNEINSLNIKESNRNIATNNDDEPIFCLPFASISLSDVKDLNIVGNEVLKIPFLLQDIGFYLDVRITGFSDGEYDTIRPGLDLDLLMYLRAILRIPQFYSFKSGEYINITCKYCKIHYFDENSIWFRAFDLKVYS